jgi:hypothetical protein
MKEGCPLCNWEGCDDCMEETKQIMSRLKQIKNINESCKNSFIKKEKVRL